MVIVIVTLILIIIIIFVLIIIIMMMVLRTVNMMDIMMLEASICRHVLQILDTNIPQPRF